MNNFEFASYLSIKGHNVYEEEGFDVEAYLLEIYSTKPINYEKMKQTAKQEGYILTKQGWQKETQSA